jgi:tetratricopeptide (TPR) repeat protein
MSGLLQILHESAETDAVRIRIRHTTSDHSDEAIATIPRLSTAEVSEAIRWYLEEYLLYPFDPAPEMAASVEKKMEDIGAQLFRQVFESSPQASAIWLALRTTIADTRFEIATDSASDPIFWELLRNPLDPVPIACSAKAFLRIPDANERGAPMPAPPGAMRVLMVIARPGGSSDVRFRSVAARVLNRLAGHRTFEFEVLRPPTLDALERKLRIAHTRGQPYTIVHFDGHGIYDDLMARYAGKQRKRGYLMFEDPVRPSVPDPIDGSRLAEMLIDYGVPIMLLNACRSARSELSSAPSTKNDIGSARSFGSVASELIRAGAGAVVAMQYNIYVDTAAQFVAEIYGELALGRSLPDSVTRARRVLFENPLRTSVSSPRDLRDWMVPLLFERYPVVIRPSTAPTAGIAIDLSNLPPPPASGFVGRDAALLELDRQFQIAGVVLLWGQVGSGKTATAVEFARWLAQTGGVERAGAGGCVLFSSFREYRTLPRVVDEAAAAFQVELQTRGVEWLTRDDSSRLQLLLELLGSKGCLWIWDNTESIGDAQAIWPPAEVAQLADFLAQVAATGARVLLTSRNANAAWMASAPYSLELPPMDLAERLELAVAVAGPNVSFPEDIWTPLFQFSQGNPFVLSLLVRQALAKSIDSPAAMTMFLDGIRSTGAEELFGASVEYALRNQFSASEQALLSLCCLFESTVNEMALDFLSQQDDPAKVVVNLKSGEYRCAPLLERASRLGVLAATARAYYAIHPGLPNHFRKIYSEVYSSAEQLRLERGFVWIHATIARVFGDRYQSGAPHAVDISIQTLSANELNLRSALTLARRRALWPDVLSILRGLCVLLGHAGRWSEFGRVIDAVMPDFVEPTSDAALPGRENFWITIQGYRADLLTHQHRLNEAERLQLEIVRRGREFLTRPDDPGTAPAESSRSAFAACLQQLALIQRDLGSKECLKTLEESLELAQRAGDIRLEGVVAYQLAGVCMQPEFLDLDAAGYWLTYALDVTPEEDPMARGTVLTGRGSHAWLQFTAQTGSPEERQHWLAESIRFYELALQVLPGGHSQARMACYANLGQAYFSAGGDLSRAVNSFQQALALQEAIGDEHQAGITRLNLARVIYSAGDISRSLLFAGAALRTFAALAPDAEQDLADAQDFIETLENPHENEQLNVV